MSWTDERVELLKKMWTEGQSASQIAKELGGVTRNAVIGKVHRLGLSNRVGGKDEDEGPVAPMATPASQRPEAPVRPEAAASAAPRAEGGGAAQAQPRPAAQAAAAPAAAAPAMPSNVMPLPVRKPIVPAGQPLPPQPGLNEISPEALASVREVEKRAKKLTLMELTERTCKWPIGDPRPRISGSAACPLCPASPIARPMSASPSSR